MKETRPKTRISDAAVGCILGTAVGDALGLACEGLSRRRQQRWYPEIERYHLLFGKGMCSDDTEHTCMIAQSIIVSGGEEGKFARDFAWRLRGWLIGMPAGIGLATLRSLAKLWLFVPERWCGVYSAGNGPAMRSALLGVCFADQEDKLIALNKISTRLTHTDPRAECGALAIALAARCASRSQDFDSFLADLERLTATLGPAGVQLTGLANQARASAMSGEPTDVFVGSLGCVTGVSGYMYHSVPAVLHAWFSHPNDFARGLTAVIRCGGDTDTTGAMLGAIVGAAVGKGGIPEQWLDDLVEWPRTVSWMEALARKAEHSASNAQAGKPHRVSIPGLLLRNTGFLLLVLAHGVRRMLPPY